MNEFINKSKGVANEVIGKAKFAAGKNLDRPVLVIKGTAQQAKGKAQQAVAAVKGWLGEQV